MPDGIFEVGADITAFERGMASVDRRMRDVGRTAAGVGASGGSGFGAMEAKAQATMARIGARIDALNKKISMRRTFDVNTTDIERRLERLARIQSRIGSKMMGGGFASPPPLPMMAAGRGGGATNWGGVATGMGLGGFAGPAAAGMAGMYGYRFAKDSINESLDYKRSMAVVDRATGGGAASKAVAGAAGQIEAATGIDNARVAAMFGKVMMAGEKDVEEARKRVMLALDMEAGNMGDANSILDAMNKAGAEVEMMFKRTAANAGIAVKDGESLNDVTRKLSDKFGGLAENVHGVSGGMGEFSVAWDNLKQRFGDMIGPAASTVARAGAKVIDKGWVEDFVGTTPVGLAANLGLSALNYFAPAPDAPAQGAGAPTLPDSGSKGDSKNAPLGARPVGGSGGRVVVEVRSAASAPSTMRASAV